MRRASFPDARGYRGMIIWWGLPTPLKNLVKVSWGYEIPNFSWKVSENSMVFHGSSHHQPVIFVSFKDHRSIYKQRNTNRTRPEPQEASYVRVSVQKRPSQLWCMTQVYIYIDTSFSVPIHMRGYHILHQFEFSIIFTIDWAWTTVDPPIMESSEVHSHGEAHGKSKIAGWFLFHGKSKSMDDN